MKIKTVILTRETARKWKQPPHKHKWKLIGSMGPVGGKHRKIYQCAECQGTKSIF